MNPFSAVARLNRFLSVESATTLGENLIGLEKEALRVRPDGHISQTSHPEALGSPLTHPWITTDYSEALLELITPPQANGSSTLSFLDNLHRFVYSKLNQEYLWSASLPCILDPEKDIPVARYGTSNAGQMKHIYRIGLGYRYGRVMQVISGIHFNFSCGEKTWDALKRLQNNNQPHQHFVSDQYMGMIRNLQRTGWLIPYLFGASPAICASFFADRSSKLPLLDASTRYAPFATSLRLSDIGYTNSKEESYGFKANYNSLDSYIQSLEWAISSPSPHFEDIGIKVNNHYRQLNGNHLQIENEYYSTVRPKPIAVGDERPAVALKRRGIRYVELRSLDLNPFEPVGIDDQQLLFLEAFMLFCLFADSPLIDKYESAIIDENLLSIAKEGRKPGLKLHTPQGDRLFTDWAEEILEGVRPFSVLLSQIKQEPYHEALDAQLEKIQNPDLTPSAKVLAEMRQNGETFHSFAERYSLKYRDFFIEHPLPKMLQEEYEEIAKESRVKQKAIEASDKQTLDDYIATYYRQRA